MGKEYTELLKDPRWQRKRLEILNRDDFTCVFCGAKDQTLHVDHKRYARGGPWNVDDKDLQTLCEICHQRITVLRREIREMADACDEVDLLKIRGFLAGIHALNGGTPPPIDLDDLGCHGLAGLLGINGYVGHLELRALVRRGASGTELRRFSWACGEKRIATSEALFALQEQAEEEVLP